MIKYFFMLALFCTISLSLIGDPQKKHGLAHDVRILVLIIASDDLPIYQELQKIWRSYMHYDPEHVESYFIKGNPNLPTKYVILGDTIWAQSPENIIPGILNKTLLSMEAILPQLSTFDYVLRTNLSSFYVFPRLLNFLQNCPRKNFYCGSSIGSDYSIASGCGFLLSPDLVTMLVNDKQALLNNAHHDSCRMHKYDDVAIGLFLNNKGIHLLTHEKIHFSGVADWNTKNTQITDNAFQFRITNPNPSNRLAEDVYIHAQLLKNFYSVEYIASFTNTLTTPSQKT